MIEVASLEAFEILDSRGRPTVLASCTLAGGAVGAASVPSGASTGAAEAHELRDGDPARHAGLGCRQAVAAIEGEIRAVLVGLRLADHAELDRLLIDLDGTPDKARLGANALLATSLAVARAGAAEAGVPLYAHLAAIADADPTELQLPRPTVNLFSGGKHAGGQMPLQDVLVTPMAASTVDEAMAMVTAVFRAAVRRCAERYGTRALVADEGGLAPPFARVEDAFEDAVAAIEMAGYAPGRDVALCIDVASTHFFTSDGAGDGSYAIDGRTLTSRGMVDLIDGWVGRYPIVSVEDGLAEDDWSGWPLLRERIGGRALVLGDDLLATNPSRIARAVAVGAATALLLKVNQIGTLTEAADARRLAAAAGWALVVSARSGETEDDWLSDLAIGWGGDQLKVGSITRSERLAKWNRLLVVEARTGMPMRPWPAPR